MIDITVSDKTIEVEMKRYYLDFSKPINNRNEILKMLQDVIYKAKYSGETISLWKIEEAESVKQFVEEWH